MDCSKTWELMMRKMDGLSKDQDSIYLESHMDLCGDCRKRWDLLQTAVSELESNSAEAPENIERSVMSRLCFIRQKEKVGMLPYVISPAAILSGLIAILMFNMYKAGPITMIDETARTLSSLVKVLQTVASAVQYVFRVPFLRETLIIFFIGAFIGVAAFVIKKMNENRVYWRASK